MVINTLYLEMLYFVNLKKSSNMKSIDLEKFVKEIQAIAERLGLNPNDRRVLNEFFNQRE